MRTFGETLKEARTGDLSQQTVADHLGVSRNTVQRWEGGSNLPSGASVQAYLDAVGADDATRAAVWASYRDAVGIPVAGAPDAA